ncbi:MAG: Zn-dependent alcohol dehydrogenase [Actinobacteria bacterium]|nr:Zn-dependent alcohol dehydrogenase [Actinomycetota bacterium]
MSRAAVLTAVGQPLELRDDVHADPPRTGEVGVRMTAAGVCHSDVAMQQGTIPVPLPCVLGHEGAGVVEAVGPDVDGLAPGDAVVLSWVAQCGACFYCRRGQPALCQQATVAMSSAGLLDGTARLQTPTGPLFQALGCGAFSEVTVVPTIAVVKVPSHVDPSVAALMGCAVVTGVGAALNTADIRPGDTVAVIGCGGVGLNVIQGARIAGAAEIVAVDVHADKLELARALGATSVVLATERNPVAAVMDLTAQHGADVAFEVIGRGPTIDQALGMTRRGGQTVLVGIPAMDVVIQIPAMVGLVLAEKTVKGCWLGSSDIRRDIPRLVELYGNGQLKLDELVSRRIDVAEVNAAFAAMEAGEVARSVVVY